MKRHGARGMRTYWPPKEHTVADLQQIDRHERFGYLDEEDDSD